MYCKNCGTNLPEGTVYCTECGANQTAGNLAPNTVNNQSQMPLNNAYNPTSYQAQPVKTEEDKKSIGLNILAWFVPLFGFIFWGIKKKDTPIKAKSVGKTALISFIVNMVICILAVVIAVVGTFSIAGMAMGELGDISDDVGGYVDEYEDYSDDIDNYLDGYVDNEEPLTEDDTTKPSQSDNKGNASVSSDWTNYEVSVNGAKITLPMSYKVFSLTTGCTFEDEQDAELTLKPNNYTYVTMKDANGRNFCIDILNESDSVLTLDRCTVITVYDFQRYSSGNAEIIFAGGLQIGDEMTEAQLKELFGEPDDTWYSDDGEAFSFEWYEDYDKYYGNRSFEVEVEDGVIDGITLEKSE